MALLVLLHARRSRAPVIARCRLCAAAFAVCVALLLSACAKNELPALRVGASIWPGYEPLYLAESYGIFDRRVVKLIDFSSNVDVMRAYRNGVIDVAALTADEALLIAQTEPSRHRIVLVMDYSNGADAIVARGEFAAMTDLRGRTIGAEANALGALMLSRALTLSGMSMRDIKFVPLALDDQESAFLNGEVDAVVTFEPRRTRLLARGAREVFSSKAIPGEVIDVLIARKSLLLARRPQFEHLAAAWFAAVEKIAVEPAQAAQRAAVHQGVSPEEFLNSLSGLQLLDRPANRRLLESGEFRAQLDRLAQIMLAANLLPSAPDTGTLIDAGHVANSPR